MYVLFKPEYLFNFHHPHFFLFLFSSFIHQKLYLINIFFLKMDLKQIVLAMKKSGSTKIEQSS